MHKCFYILSLNKIQTLTITIINMIYFPLFIIAMIFIIIICFTKKEHYK